MKNNFSYCPNAFQHFQQGFDSPRLHQLLLYEQFGTPVIMIGDLFVFEKSL